MSRLFADAFYFFAVLNAKDAAHRKALEFAIRHEEPIVTTTWVLTELADGFGCWCIGLRSRDWSPASKPILKTRLSRRRRN